MSSKNEFPNVREFHDYVVDRGICKNPDLTLRTPLGDILDFPVELNGIKATVRSRLTTTCMVVKVNFAEFRSELTIKAFPTLNSSIHAEWELKYDNAEYPYYKSDTSVYSNKGFYSLVIDVIDICTDNHENYLENKTQQ